MHDWCSKETELLLTYAVLNYNNKIIVELGSWLGKSTCIIIKNMSNNSCLYCFDRFSNVATSKYDFSKYNKIDNFYFSTPRYETFVRNIRDYIDNDKKVYTIKYDVNYSIKKLTENNIVPDRHVYHRVSHNLV